jgi:restriction endonuclease Mrr
MVGGRIGLTQWLMRNDLARLERDALQALAKYSEAARRAVASKISELPGHAFVEFSLLILERMGVGDLKTAKFPGASGAEVHFSGVLHVPGSASGEPIGHGDGLPLGIVIRKDGRDIGRERVTELRGSVHHYESAAMGWILSAGQILSGAREEAKGQGTLPVSLLDAAALAQLCEEHGVGVVRATHPICVPDVDLFEALRST